MVRVAVLWQDMSGYFNACLKALSASADVDLFVAHPEVDPEVPFDDAQFAWLPIRHLWRGQPDARSLIAELESFRPDVVLVSSWHIPPYRKVVKHFQGRALRILCMDNQWMETPKQWLGRLSRRIYLAPYFDMAFVSGDRQAQFARHLGFGQTRILRGLYCCDTDAFQRPVASEPDRAFFFCGRLVESKGVTVLMQAYEKYRRSIEHPWPLRVAGVGPLSFQLDQVEGVELLGFLQPAALPEAMWSSTALVLPSLFEPWGVVVHEAATAGLILVCSEATGAAVHLLQDGYNGYLFPTGNADLLAQRMLALSVRSDEELKDMREASVLMSGQLTPDRWASYLLEAVASATAPQTGR
jgi:glycosyltransferase involved in cell wall biosynthesis